MLGLKVEAESKEIWSNLHVKDREKERNRTPLMMMMGYE